MKILKLIGLVIFITGFFIFNASFFWASYKLTPEIVKEKITDERKQKLFLSGAYSLKTQTVLVSLIRTFAISIPNFSFK
jgi:hypothetical protein